MVKYRPQRGSLSESVKNQREFNNLDEMCDHVLSIWNKSDMRLIGKDDMEISKDFGPDERVGWKETRYICIKRMGDQKYDPPQCIGYCSIE